MQGHDYIFPDTNAIKLLMDNGMNIFRVQFLMERLTPNGMTGSFYGAYLKNMARVKYAIVACTILTTEGGGLYHLCRGHAVSYPHNYGRL